MDVTAALAQVDISAVLLTLELAIGLALSIKLAGEVSLFMGGKVDVNLAAMLEYSLAKWEVQKGNSVHMASCIMLETKP